jgi:hypothetical protein
MDSRTYCSYHTIQDLTCILTFNAKEGWTGYIAMPKTCKYYSLFKNPIFRKGFFSFNKKENIVFFCYKNGDEKFICLDNYNLFISNKNEDGILLTRKEIMIEAINTIIDEFC